MAQVPVNTPPAVHLTINQQLIAIGIKNADFICRKVQELLALKEHWIKVIQPMPAQDYDSLQAYLKASEDCYTQMAEIYEELMPLESLAIQIYPDLWRSPFMMSLREHYLALKERK
jgi:hypothetical protein